MSQIVVLSAHTGLLDRRIVAQLNALAASARQVTLVTTPVTLEGSGLDDRVRVAMAPEGIGSRLSKQWMRRAYRSLPSGIRALRQVARHVFRGDTPPPPTSVLVRLARGMPADIIHCHDLETLPAAVAIRDMVAESLPGRRSPRIIYDTHELFPFQDPSWPYRRYWLRQERLHIKAADAIIAVNASVAEELARIHSVPRPVVLYNSFGGEVPRGTPDRRAARARLRVPEGSALPVVLFQGGLTWSRNLRNLVLAFEGLRNTAHLAILGGGPAEVGLRRLARSLPNVSFAPWVPPDALLEIVRGVELGVIPYRGDRCLNDRLCTPNKLFEFMEAGIPVCASDLPELRKIVRDCGIGDVFDMHSPTAIADAISETLFRAARKEFRGLDDPGHTAHLRWPAQERVLTELYTRLSV